MDGLRKLLGRLGWHGQQSRYSGTFAGAVFNTAAIVVPALLVAAFGVWSWGVITREAAERVERAASLAADRARRMFETQDVSLEAALSRVRGIQPDVIGSDASIHEFLRRLQMHTLSSSALSIVDLQRGAILSSSTSLPPPDVDLSDREYVAFHRGSRSPSTHVGKIVHGVASGRAGFTVSRRDPDRLVAAVTMIPLDGSTAFEKSNLLKPGDSMKLAREDGAMLAIPLAGEATGSRLPENSPLLRLLNGKATAPLRAISATDHVDRLWSYAKVGEYPVYVLYGVDASTLRSEWLSRFVPFALLALIGSGLLLLAGVKAQRALAARKLAELEVGWVRARAQHAEALQESEARFRVLFEELPLPAWVIDPASLRILDCNQRAADLLGVSQSKLCTMRVPDFEARYDADEIARNEQRIAKDGRLTLETKHRAADGTLHDMLISAHSVRLGGRMLTYANGIDITERNKAEERVREADSVARERLAELEQIYRYSPVGLFTLDRELRYVKVNQRLAELNGMPAQDHIGRTVEEVLGEHGPRARQELERILITGEPLLDVEMTIGEPGTRSARHFLCSWYPFRSSSGDIVGIAGAIADVTESKRSEMHNRLLMQEVNHRAKNMLSVIQAIARNTVRSGDPATFVERLSERIRGLAACQDLLVNGSWRGIDLDALVRSQLAHFADLIGTRIRIEGPSVHVCAAAAQAIGMAIHELCTNAGKYGSLSRSNGSVAIKWSMKDDDFEMEWCESGGPPVKPPARRGFGHTVIETMAASALLGKARLEYSETGVCWFLSAPHDAVVDGGEPPRAPA